MPAQKCLQLLKYQSLAPQTHLANSFAISNLKKRILFMNQKPSSKWKLSLFATSFLALAGVTAAMAFDKKENIVYLEAEPIVDVAPENGTELPTIIEQNAERPKSTATNTTKENIEQKHGINGEKDELNIIIRQEYKQLYSK